ncbi:9425_t:CDS:2 [Diversispora eburnea]|uniref:9425_t:CDS:1 n=1 Tax=Diversispora eburnea TaxID=1213867 RepID=A0A9N8W8Z1_9GLOM|nr:9425_t:CDS:2 [Diversispora eburnea]
MNYMETLLNLYDIQTMRFKRSVPTEESNSTSHSINHSIEPTSKISANASAQRRAAEAIKTVEQKIYKFE